MATDDEDRETEVVHRARAEFRRHGGLLRIADAIRYGFTRRTLYAMRDAGQVEVPRPSPLRLANAPPLGVPISSPLSQDSSRGCLPDLRARVPQMTTQIPHEVCLAVPRDSDLRVSLPPFVRFG